MLEIAHGCYKSPNEFLEYWLWINHNYETICHNLYKLVSVSSYLICINITLIRVKL